MLRPILIIATLAVAGCKTPPRGGGGNIIPFREPTGSASLTYGGQPPAASMGGSDRSPDRRGPRSGHEGSIGVGHDRGGRLLDGDARHAVSIPLFVPRAAAGRDRDRSGCVSVQEQDTQMDAIRSFSDHVIGTLSVLLLTFAAGALVGRSLFSWLIAKLPFGGK